MLLRSHCCNVTCTYYQITYTFGLKAVFPYSIAWASEQYQHQDADGRLETRTRWTESQYGYLGVINSSRHLVLIDPVALGREHAPLRLPPQALSAFYSPSYARGSKIFSEAPKIHNLLVLHLILGKLSEIFYLLTKCECGNSRWVKPIGWVCRTDPTSCNSEVEEIGSLFEEPQLPPSLSSAFPETQNVQFNYLGQSSPSQSRRRCQSRTSVLYGRIGISINLSWLLSQLPAICTTDVALYYRLTSKCSNLQHCMTIRTSVSKAQHGRSERLLFGTLAVICVCWSFIEVSDTDNFLGVTVARIYMTREFCCVDIFLWRCWTGHGSSSPGEISSRAGTINNPCWWKPTPNWRMRWCIDGHP